jgi:hypothetical protein
MVSAQLIGFLACSTRSRRPAGKVKSGALIAAKIFVAAENRRALRQIALALGVEDHLFRLSRAAAPARTRRPFAPEEIEVEQGEKEVDKPEQE